MKQILLAIFITFLSGLIHAGAHPNLLEVKIGETFAHPRANEFPDENRPTTQFKVPNYGTSKALFSEYEVVILNNSKKVVIASAEASFSTLQKCKNSSDNLQQILKHRFSDFKNVKGEEFSLTGVNTAYAKEEENSFYTLNCIRRNGPFWILDFNIRGKLEDKELKSAWKMYFSNRR